MENFYSKVKTHKSHNPGYGSKHFIEIPFRMLIIGPSGSGKTNALLNLLKAMNDTWDHIYLCLKDANEPLYQMLINKLGDDITVFEGGEVPSLESIDKNGQQLMIFDDLVGDKKANESISEYFKMARKKDISCCYLSQSYYAVPKFIRSNCSQLVIRKVATARDLSLILSEYPLDISKEELRSIYNECTRGFTDIMSIDLQNGHIYRNLNIRVA